MDLYSLLPTDNYLPEKGVSTKAEFHIQNTESRWSDFQKLVISSFVHTLMKKSFSSCAFLSPSVTISPVSLIKPPTASLGVPGLYGFGSRLRSSKVSFRLLVQRYVF